MAAGDFAGWPGESNGDPKPKDKQHVPVPDVCPLCSEPIDGRYTEHIRTGCEGKRHAAGGELVADGGASAEYKGVHTADESVIEETIAAIETRLDRTTGDCTHFRTGVLINEGEFDVAGQKVSAALRDIASAGEHGRDGIVVERTNPGSQRARWRAWRVPEIATDGGVAIAAGDDPSPTTAVLQVLEDGHSDGVERLDVIERAAALSQTTRDEAEYALEDLRKRGEVYGFDGIVKKTPGGSFEERWGGFS